MSFVVNYDHLLNFQIYLVGWLNTIHLLQF